MPYRSFTETYGTVSAKRQSEVSGLELIEGPRGVARPWHDNMPDL
jgi:hypothetical protein